jgi:transposase
MAQTLCILPGAAEIEWLKQIIGDRNHPFKRVRRAKIALYSGARLPVLEVARRTGVSRPAVWLWRQRFAEEGGDGLLRDKTRKPARRRSPKLSSRASSR